MQCVCWDTNQCLLLHKSVINFEDRISEHPLIKLEREMGGRNGQSKTQYWRGSQYRGNLGWDLGWDKVPAFPHRAPRLPMEAHEAVHTVGAQEEQCVHLTYNWIPRTLFSDLNS
jgi:hypothetical protein